MTNRSTREPTGGTSRLEGPARKLETTLAVTGLSVLVVLFLELGAWGVVGLANRLGIGATEARAAAPAFAHAGYDGQALLAEQESLPRPRYEPLVLWRARPFQGRFFNVGEDGFRRTIPSPDDADAYEVWVLGGSTVFGYGAPDGETLPSHLARLLNRGASRPVRVRNLGQGGYVSAQEGALLLTELARGGRPDLVLFYDGYNDAVAMKNFPGSPLPHFQLDRIRARLESPLTSLLLSSGAYRLIEASSHSLLPRGEGRARPREETEELGRRAARIREIQHQTARALGRERGFRVVTFLQPARDHSVLEAMRRTLASEPLEGFHDLGRVFDGVEIPVYVDGVHVTGPGNGRIARRIVEILETEGAIMPVF